MVVGFLKSESSQISVTEDVDKSELSSKIKESNENTENSAIKNSEIMEMDNSNNIDSNSRVYKNAWENKGSQVFNDKNILQIYLLISLALLTLKAIFF